MSLDRAAVIIISDTHIGSTLALCPGAVNLDDGGTYTPNPIQRWLWSRWNLFLEQADKIADGRPKVYIINGDALELDAAGRSWQLMSRNPATVTALATTIFEPLRQEAAAMFVIRGTEAHTGPLAHAEEELARDLDCNPASTNQYSHWHLLVSIAGVRFDIAHHANLGRTRQAAAGACVRQGAEALADYAERGEKPPHIMVRSHNHRYADSGRNLKNLLYVAAPCWQMHTAYSYRIGAANKFPDIGGLVFLVDDGEYEYHNLLYAPQARRYISV